MTFEEIIQAIGVKPYYKDEWVAIYHADCRDILPSIPDKSFDLVLTDPPFLVMFGTTEEKNELGNYTILEGWFADQLRLLIPTIKPAGNLMLLCDWRTYPSFWREAIKADIIPRNLVVWIHGAARKWHLFRYCHQLALVAQKPPVKPDGVPHGKLFDYWMENNVATLERKHPTEKPEGYIDYLMDAGSKLSDLILDPFLGSGTTCYCAKKLNRYSMGIEIEEKYCEIAAQRCCQSVMELKE